MIKYWLVMALLSPSGEVLDAYKKPMQDERSCHAAEYEAKLPNGNWIVVKCGMEFSN